MKQKKRQLFGVKTSFSNPKFSYESWKGRPICYCQMLVWFCVKPLIITSLL